MSVLDAPWLPALFRPRAAQPRFGAWWRLPVFETAGKCQRNPSTGKVKRKSADGKKLRNTASDTKCCCGTTCEYCATAPSTWSITISGVTSCPTGTCEDQSTGGGVTVHFKVLTPFQNGTYCAIYSPCASANQCQWLYCSTSSSLAAVTYYTASSCGGTPTTYNGIQINFAIDGVGSPMVLEIYSPYNFVSNSCTPTSTSNPVGGTYTCAGGPSLFFRGVGTTPSNPCSSPITFTNLATSCASFATGYYATGYGGTAVLTPGGC